MCLKLFTIVIFFQIATSCCYYWRDYYGKIPQDAFKAGVDANNENVYIGQAFYKSDHTGIYPTNIQSGKLVSIPLYGAKNADNFVQILCANDPEIFQWIPTNKTHLHLLDTNNKIVRGGVEDNSWVNIGRVKYQGGTSVGKVLSGQIGNALLYFVHNGKEVASSSYELLTHNDILSNIDVRFQP